ncbi:hypothetical protein [Streptococcus sp. HJ1]
MQPRLTVSVLVLQAEVLVRAIRYLGFLFQMTFTVRLDFELTIRLKIRQI